MQALICELHEALNSAPRSPRSLRPRSVSMEGGMMGTAKAAERSWRNFVISNQSMIATLMTVISTPCCCCGLFGTESVSPDWSDLVMLPVWVT